MNSKSPFDYLSYDYIHVAISFELYEARTFEVFRSKKLWAREGESYYSSFRWVPPGGKFSHGSLISQNIDNLGKIIYLAIIKNAITLSKYII